MTMEGHNKPIYQVRLVLNGSNNNPTYQIFMTKVVSIYNSYCFFY